VGRAQIELTALATTALERLASCWRHTTAAPDPELLARWLDLAARLPEPPAALELERIWQHVVPAAVTPYSAPEAARYLRWLTLARTLQLRAPERLEEFGFPRDYEAQLDALLALELRHPAIEESGTLRASLLECLRSVSALLPDREVSALRVLWLLRSWEPPPDTAPEPLAARPDAPPRQWSIVRRILADLT
jgi:hypothetical protein